MTEKKVLIITYYWPPSGGSGVQRWLKFAKYLPQYGWTPYIFTPENPSFAIKDESLSKDVPDEAEVIRFPIWEPYDAFIKLSKLLGGGQRSAKPTDLVSAEKKSLFQTISTWIRGNFFIPDPRVFWVKPSVNFLEDFIQHNKIKTVITTGPPHSVHLIGYRLKKKLPSIQWLADFRDPWTEWGLWDSLLTGSLARKLHKRYETKVLQTADKIVTITPFYVRRFQALAQRRVHLLTNGYDHDDFKDITIRKNDIFLIRHVGIVNEKCDPRPLLLAVRDLISENEGIGNSLRLEFIGEVHSRIKQFVDSTLLESIVVFTGNVPHKELIRKYGDSALLILVLHGYKDAEGFMPGKLFEYMATGLPILGIGPTKGDAADLLRETNAGVMIEGDDVSSIKHHLKEQYLKWKGDTRTLPNVSTSKYSRKEITKSLVDLF